MAFLEEVASRIGLARLLRLMRLYPPYLGAGVSVTHVDPELHLVEVEMKLRGFNRNFVGTQFGGSLYSMCDPWFMLMLIHHLGPGYVIWDKSAQIDFLKPGRGTVRACFELPVERIAQIRSETDATGKTNPTFEARVVDGQGDAIARVTKLLSVRRKDRTAPRASG